MHAIGHALLCGERPQPGLIRTLADQHQPRAGNVAQGRNGNPLTLALDQCAHAGEQGRIVGHVKADLPAELGAQLRVVERAEAVTVQPGVMHRDPVRIHAHRRHLRCQIVADGGQKAGL
jgi:hypothetical protein